MIRFLSGTLTAVILMSIGFYARGMATPQLDAQSFVQGFQDTAQHINTPVTMVKK